MAERPSRPEAPEASDRRRVRRAGAVTALAGMLLVATTYGMARFGVGLFAPALEVTRPALAGALAWAGAAQFASYTVAALAVARVADRRPRVGLVLAGLTSTAGCLGVALAVHPAVLLLSVVVAGTGGALASPSLVPVVDAAVPAAGRAAAQSVVNAGTAVGVVGAGAVAALVPAVGPAWGVMALLCAASAVAAWWSARWSASRARAAAPGPGASRQDAADAPRPLALVVPAAAAVLAGAGSALVWSFGPLVLTASGAVARERAGWLWVALGVGGVLGVLAGSLVRRVGLRSGWAVCAGALGLATGGVALATATQGAAVASAAMALFGAAYMAGSGVLILWARHAWPDRGGAGTSLLFVALATGQALGSAGLGAARDAVPAPVLAGAAALLCLVGAAVGLLRPGAGRPA